MQAIEKKYFHYKEASNKNKTFGLSSLSNIQRKDGKQDTDFESSCPKTKLLIDILTKEFLAVALKESESEDQDELEPISIFR